MRKWMWISFLPSALCLNECVMIETMLNVEIDMSFLPPLSISLSDGKPKSMWNVEITKKMEEVYLFSSTLHIKGNDFDRG